MYVCMYMYIYIYISALSTCFNNNMANAHTCEAGVNLVPHLESDKMYGNSEM